MQLATSSFGRRAAGCTFAAVAFLFINVTTASAAPPPVSEQARAAGFVDVRTAVPDAIIDLRYATANNFVGTSLYPADARCLVHESLAQGLATAANALRVTGEVLVFWDCYRPHDVQVRMYEAVPNPNWVARPGAFARSHESGPVGRRDDRQCARTVPAHTAIGRSVSVRHGNRL